MTTKGSAKVLVDTSAWIEFFRRNEPWYSSVNALLNENRVCCIGLIMAELMQGAKSNKEMAVIRDFVHLFEFLPDTLESWGKTGELSFALRRKGKKIGLADCFIAVLAARHGAEIATLDKHFEEINTELKIRLFTG